MTRLTNIDNGGTLTDVCIGGVTQHADFVANWVTAEPPSHLPYYGSWGDDNSVIHATAWTSRGPLRVAGPMGELPQILLPDPNVLALAAQQARIAELEARLHEVEPGDG